MSGLFSSRGKSAQQGASGLQGVDQNIINQLENYTAQQQQSARGAIAGLGTNPYFQAAQTMNPDAYRVNPSQTETFGSTGGPGTHVGASGMVAAGGSAPPWKPAQPKGGGGTEKQPGGGGNTPYLPPTGGGGHWGDGTGHNLL